MPEQESSGATVNGISKADLETLRENASLRITDKVRALALSVVAFSWALLSADKAPVSQINLAHHQWLLATVLLSVVSLLLDLLQTLGNYTLFNSLRHKMEREKQEVGQFDAGSFLYRGQNWAFVLKIVLCVGSCLSLLVLVGLSL